jgi:hypothetical protein
VLRMELIHCRSQAAGETGGTCCYATVHHPIFATWDGAGRTTHLPGVQVSHSNGVAVGATAPCTGSAGNICSACVSDGGRRSKERPRTSALYCTCMGGGSSSGSSNSRCSGKRWRWHCCVKQQCACTSA